MELNPRRGRKDEGRAGHGMGEDDGHAGREEQEGAAMERERCGPPPPSRPPRARRPRRAGRGRGGSPAGAGRGQGGPPAEAERGRRRKQEGAAMERERCGREKRGGRGQRAKLSFYLTSQLKMSSLLDVVCGRLNDSFAVCWEQIRVWRCALHKIMLSQCPVDKFPNYYICLYLLFIFSTN